MRAYLLLFLSLICVDTYSMDLSHIEIRSIPIDETNEDMSESERNRLCRATFGRDFRSSSNVCSSRLREYGERSLTSQAGYWIDYLLGNKPEEEYSRHCEMMCSRTTERDPLTPEQEAILLESWRESFEVMNNRQLKNIAGRNYEGSRRVNRETPDPVEESQARDGGRKVQLR